MWNTTTGPCSAATATCVPQQVEQVAPDEVRRVRRGRWRRPRAAARGAPPARARRRPRARRPRRRPRRRRAAGRSRPATPPRRAGRARAAARSPGRSGSARCRRACRPAARRSRSGRGRGRARRSRPPRAARAAGPPPSASRANAGTRVASRPTSLVCVARVEDRRPDRPVVAQQRVPQPGVRARRRDAVPAGGGEEEVRLLLAAGERGDPGQHLGVVGDRRRPGLEARGLAAGRDREAPVVTGDGLELGGQTGHLRNLATRRPRAAGAQRGVRSIASSCPSASKARSSTVKSRGSAPCVFVR